MRPTFSIHFTAGATPDPGRPPRTWTQQDFVGCLLTGLLAAMPYFLEAFLTCLGGGGATGDYRPGDRTRC